MKNGFVDGVYYEDDKIAYGKGLVCVEGDYYYITSNGTYFVGKITITAEKMNGYEFAPGDYTFEDNGKMDTTVKNGFVGGYYYVDGKIAYGKGLVYTNDAYYYITSKGEAFTGLITLRTEKMNGHNLTPGDYFFNADGTMEVNP